MFDKEKGEWKKWENFNSGKSNEPQSLCLRQVVAQVGRVLIYFLWRFKFTK